MEVAVGDTLRISMTLQGTVWHQAVVDSTSGVQVTFDEDLEGQSQNLAIFAFEEFSSTPSPDVTFTDTTITWASPDFPACALIGTGLTYSASPVESSPDGTQCSVATMVLYPLPASDR